MQLSFGTNGVNFMDNLNGNLILCFAQFLQEVKDWMQGRAQQYGKAL